MSASDDEGEGVHQAGGPSTNVRLYLRASGLPKSSVATSRQPDTLARVSLLHPNGGGGFGAGGGYGIGELPPPVPVRADGEDEEGDGSEGWKGGVVDETEVSCNLTLTVAHNICFVIAYVLRANCVRAPSDLPSLNLQTQIVHKSSNPRWTSTFSARYEYGSQLLFFVDVFAVRPAAGNVVSATIGNVVGKARGMKFLGRAVFDVQDVLGSRNNVKARRLRKGGV